MRKERWINLAWRLGGILLALLFTSLVLLATSAPPFRALFEIVSGALGTTVVIANVLKAWVPLMLVTMGLLITFSAGLWNIGIEGQIMLGAVFTTGMMRIVQDSALPAALIISLSILAGMLGGALWAALTGALKTFGGVNEIFGGLGLNFVGTAITIWLIFGPWKRPGTASMSGTERFAETLWLPQFQGYTLSPVSLLLVIVSVMGVYFLLQGTYFGLRLKGVGKNAHAAYLLGVPTWQYMMAAFMLCGVLAGLAGAVQVLGVYHNLIPSISSGYGYLGLMVAMLVNYQVAWSVPVALFFAALNIGSIRLPILLKLDSTIAGVLQGTLVLCMMLVSGARERWAKK
jgi:ABC-type uncharacterized transport system permease subunit